MPFPRPVNIPKTDTFDLWRQKCNQLSQEVGNLDLLVPPLDVATSVVDALNIIQATVASNERGILVRAIAMS